MAKVSSSSRPLPLAVDFDGTMHLGDLNWMALRWLLRTHAGAALGMIFRIFFFGRASMKLFMQAQALRRGWRPVMAWDLRVLALMAKAREQGRDVVVVTGSPTLLVREILHQNSLDYSVLGTDVASLNLVKENKARAMVARWGHQAFDYAGNSPDDLKVWPFARHALVVNATPAVLERARALGNVSLVLPLETATDVCGCC